MSNHLNQSISLEVLLLTLVRLDYTTNRDYDVCGVRMMV
jgi:hypothetical protein